MTEETVANLTLTQFNALSPDQAVAAVYRCCHCKTWAQALVASRPFHHLEQLYRRAEELWAKADEAQILEAFSGHARIGDINLLRSKFATTAKREQGQVLAASEAVIQSLYQLNRDYEAKNGFIFIVCASGKSAEQMLNLLQQRIGNSRAQELQNGAAEQGKITQLRLARLLAPTQ